MFKLPAPINDIQLEIVLQQPPPNNVAVAEAPILLLKPVITALEYPLVVLLNPLKMAL
jgi:hypothetical protein